MWPNMVIFVQNLEWSTTFWCHLMATAHSRSCCQTTGFFFEGQVLLLLPLSLLGAKTAQLHLQSLSAEFQWTLLTSLCMQLLPDSCPYATFILHFVFMVLDMTPPHCFSTVITITTDNDTKRCNSLKKGVIIANIDTFLKPHLLQPYELPQQQVASLSTNSKAVFGDIACRWLLWGLLQYPSFLFIFEWFCGKINTTPVPHITAGLLSW